MKKYYSIAVACTALFFFSCQKEDVKSTMVNSTTTATASSNAAITAKFIPNKLVNYGALIDAPSKQGSLDFQLNVADQVGISCLRSRTLVPGIGKVPILNQGYKVLLNFNSDYEGSPLPFVTNLPKYQSDLKTIIAGFITKPVVAVIENEESNAGYYSGTAQEYIRQLNAAISVMHSYGIKVANGGITSTGLNYLVYQDFMSQGKADSAKAFQQLTKLAVKNAQTQDRGAFVDALLQAYTSMDLDYVNFHWKGSTPDVQALSSVINYLQKRTRKTVMSNELGQFDTDPNTLLNHIQLCTDRGFPYIIWYSPDQSAGRKGYPLHYSNASLTGTGVTYQSYLKG